MIKTLKHLRFMLVMLLATLGVNVAFGAESTLLSIDPEASISGITIAPSSNKVTYPSSAVTWNSSDSKFINFTSGANVKYTLASPLALKAGDEIILQWGATSTNRTISLSVNDGADVVLDAIQAETNAVREAVYRISSDVNLSSMKITASGGGVLLFNLDVKRYDATGSASVIYAVQGKSKNVNARANVTTISNMSNAFMFTNLTTSTSNGQNNFSGEITGQITTASTDHYVALSFTVGDGYVLTPSACSLNVMSNSTSMKTKVEITDGTTSVVSNETTGSTTSTAVTFTSDAFTGKVFSGTVTIKVHTWGVTSKRAYVGNITLNGNVSEKTPAGPVDPTATFDDANYEIGETLDLATLFDSNSEGAVTYTVKDAGTTGATISGSNFTATAAGPAVVTASQAAVADKYNAGTWDATITVTAPVAKYAVSFAANGGTSTMTALEYAAGVEVTLPTCTFIAPAGKEFDAWTSTDVTIADGKFTMPANDVELKATWKDKATDYVLVGATPTTDTETLGQIYKMKSYTSGDFAMGGGMNVTEGKTDGRYVGFTIPAGCTAKVDIAGKGSSNRVLALVTEADRASGTWTNAFASATMTGTSNVVTASTTTNLNPGTYAVGSTGSGLTITSVIVHLYGTPVVVPAHHVTYAKGDAAVTGTLPTQADVKENGTFTVAGKGDLAWTGHTFTGWNDETADYAAGSTYTMGTADVTLTAQWDEINCSAFQVTCTNGQLEPFEEWLTYTRDQNATADIWSFNLVAVTGGTVATYEWYRNTVDAHEGENLVRWNQDTDPSYTSQYSKLPDVSTPGVYYYFCKVTSTDGCVAYSKTITYTVNAVASSQKQLTRVKFSNNFDAFVKESDHSVTAYYMGATAPEVVADSWVVSEKATAAVVDNKIVVTAEDGTTQDYAITLTQVTPVTAGEYTFDGNESWVKTGYTYSSTRGWRMSQSLDGPEADKMRIAEGWNRVNFFVAACENLTLYTASGITNDRPIEVYRNGVKLTGDGIPTTAPKYNENGTAKITIPGDIQNPSYITIVNKGNGDGGFGKAEVKEHIVSADATLKTLKYGETPITLVAEQFTYSVELPWNTAAVPALAAETNDANATTAITDATAFVEKAATSTVVVTAEDGVTTKTYTVTFTLADHYVAQIGTTGYTTLADAIAAVPADGTETTITVLEDVVAPAAMTISSSKNIVLNLNGKTVQHDGAYLFVVGNATLHVTGTGVLFENAADQYAPIVAKGSGADVANYTNIIIDENVTLKGDYCGIFVAKDAAGTYKNYGLNITVKGTIDLAAVEGAAANYGVGVYVNGNNTIATGNVMNINLDGATISGGESGVYAAGYANWTLKNCTITGYNTAVEVRSGKMEINCGTYTALNPTFSCTANGNGATVEGAAIAIAQHTTKKDIDVKIVCGEFNGTKALYEANPQANDPAPMVALAVTDGTFKGAVETVDVLHFVSGGQFANVLDADQCAEGYAPVTTPDAEGMYTVKRVYTFDAWVDEVDFTKAGEWTMYSVSSTSGKIEGTSQTSNFANNKAIENGDNVKAYTQKYFVVKFVKDVKAIKFNTYLNNGTLRTFKTLKVAENEEKAKAGTYTAIDVTDKVTREVSSETRGNTYTFTIENIHFEAGKYYYFELSNAMPLYDFFYTEAEKVGDEVRAIFAGKIGGVDMTEAQLAELNGAEHTLTLAEAVAFAPEVELSYARTQAYDDAFVDTLAVEKNVAIVESRVANDFVYARSFESVEYKVVVPVDVTPALSLNETAGTAAIVGKTGRSKSFTVVLTGANLAPGEYNVNVPVVDGLNVAPTTFTVGTDNKVAETFIITYASDADVAQAVANIEFTANTLVADPATKTVTFALTYSSVAWVDYTLLDVTGDMTWNFANAPVDSYEATSDGIKSTAANQLMANIANIRNDASFESQYLVMGKSGEFAYRAKDSKGTAYPVYQGTSLKFTTTVPGFVTVEARAAGTTNLIIGDSNWNSISKNTTSYTAFVPAGDVEIVATGTDPVRIYTLTFTAAAEVATGREAGRMYTYCPAQDVAANFIGNVEFYQPESFDGFYVNLIKVNELTAGYGYIMIPTAATVYAVFNGEVHTEAVDASAATHGMQGFLSANPSAIKTIDDTNDNNLVIISNHLYYANNNWLTPGKAYICLDIVRELTGEPENPAPRRRVGFAGNATTGLEMFEVTEDMQKLLINGQLYIIRGGKMFNAAGLLVK